MFCSHPAEVIYRRCVIQFIISVSLQKLLQKAKKESFGMDREHLN